MHIVVSAKSFVPDFGGTINYARMLSRAFREEGHQVCVITRTKEGPDEVDGVSVFRNPSWGKKSELARDADILLQVESSWQDALPFLLRGVLWFPTLHRGFTPPKPFDFKSRIRISAERIAFKMGNTRGVSEYVLKSWGVEGECIGSSYEDGIFTNSNPDGERDIDVCFIGRMTYDKGALVLLEALDAICTRKPGLVRRALLAGTGPALDEVKSECQKLERKYGIEVNALGSVATSEEVASYLNRTKVHVFPTTSSWLEASPIVPLEGLACGCRVVASDIGGTRENVGPRGTLATPDDALDLAEKIATAIPLPRNENQADVDDFLGSHKVLPTARRYLEVFRSKLLRD